MSDDARRARAQARYTQAAHGMQSGVAMEMNHRPQPTEPKHLRVGINSAMVDNMAIARLLMAKGVITEIEYIEAVADAMETERTRYEKHLSELIGIAITLG